MLVACIFPNVCIAQRLGKYWALVESVIVVLGPLLQHWVQTAAHRAGQDRAHLGGELMLCADQHAGLGLETDDLPRPTN
jgi:hypothetical protein